MKFVNSKIRLNMPKINQLSKAAITALEQTGEALHTEITNAQVMPYDQGDMQNKNTFPDYTKCRYGVFKLVTAGPQPRRLYYHPEYNFQKKENPNAGGEWYKDWISGSKKNFCSRTFTKLYKKEAGL